MGCRFCGDKIEKRINICKGCYEGFDLVDGWEHDLKESYSLRSEKFLEYDENHYFNETSKICFFCGVQDISKKVVKINLCKDCKKQN